MTDYDPDAQRFREYAEGHTNDSPVDLSGREGAPRTTCSECTEPLDDDDIDNDVGKCKECRAEDSVPLFTPGPWSIAYDEPRPWDPKRTPNRIVDKEGNPLIVCGVTATSWGNPEVDANARLIAAAPNMYEALRLSRLAIKSLPADSLGRDPQDGYFYSDELLTRIDAALALARGEGQ